ncbi:carbon-nitrogen hydrolase family protein [Polynucleobacter sphagniphilus]|jgi:nitrilase|uniref:Amidohydrolase n=1 Tax=Polynucleobacter sphagniphilus TaxID=1743169 RepID=A0AA43M6F3_9BURK|nr:carbon-nitrogen hydrolase family protein [Polynucleobacter sphagniphilus]MDF9788700.1 putative amidohydrolase [Polynucleobacter sphagniphilus]MDH6155299.1 putative amidohydrolase [Polynucleobacter sphagniphilus]MDH6241868.1 putative amidohydrolase [Polynucleobacter sphagniphilus]MDH6249204.1 putative amidohydrolase [Polynucleobacter sphagniphilus]MDH6300177.1 putative amidohydrolase [Polynucleobacter sphagniphilus]
MNKAPDNAILKIASVQMISTPNLEENLNAAGKLVHLAAQDGAQVVVLPEYFCLLGLKDTDKLAVREVFGKGPIQERLAAIAQANSIYLVAGTIPLEAREANKVLNSTLIFDLSGRCISRYDKIHLFGFQTLTERYQESETIEAGNQPGLVSLDINGVHWRFGLSVCYDLRFPELYRSMGEVDCHLIPAAFTYTTGKEHWEVLLRARAIENQCYVLASAQGGTHRNGRRTWGHSMLIDPWGAILGDLPEGEGFISGLLSKEKLNEVRSKLPALKHRKL